MEIIKQIKQVGEHAKFSWKEACSDISGKSSFMPLTGVFLIIIGGLGAIYAAVLKNAEILSQFTIIAGLGSSILVGRKIMEGKPQLEDVIVNNETKVEVESNDSH